jgi:tetratricopeptide (TPR) repeat protein
LALKFLAASFAERYPEDAARFLRMAVDELAEARIVAGPAERARLTDEQFELQQRLAEILRQEDRMDESISALQRALELRPNSAVTHVNLGASLRSRGRLDQAIYHYRQALALDPDFAQAHNNLGNALVQLGQFAQAVGHFRRALQIDPDYTLANAQLLSTLDLMARRQPDQVPTLHSLAWLLATHPDPQLRQPDVALRLALRATELTDRRNALAFDALGAAYAATGQFDQAAESASSALRLAENSSLAGEIRARLELYAQNTAYTEPVRPTGMLGP